MHLLSLVLINTTHTYNDYAEPSTTCCQAMKNERCFWPRGRMIGGDGGINCNDVIIAYNEEFDEWKQQGNEGWSANDVLPFFKKATTKLGNETNPMGYLHLDHFLHVPSYKTLKDIMIGGTNEVGNLTRIKSQGFEEILGTVDKGRRMSPGKTYLARVARKRPNLHVITNSVVTKIHFEQDKATGVQFLLNNEEYFSAHAKREVILSAGTFNSPKLLMLSGVGPRDHLESLNISVVKDLQVGQNLQNHGMMALTLKLTKNIPDISDADVTSNALYEYLMFQKGAMASSPILKGFIKTQEETPFHKPDVMVVTHISKPSKHVNMFQFLQFKEDLEKKFLSKTEGKTILEIQGFLMKPKSRSFVKLHSRDALQSPLIHNNMAEDEEDKQTLLRYIRFVQKLQKTETFKHYGLELITIPLEECDKFTYDTDAYWLCYIRYFYISSWHGSGTCRMGPSTDPSAVVDNRLKVYGLKGLRVIGASIMPNITSANTYGPTVLIAEKAAQLIKEDWANAAV